MCIEALAYERASHYADDLPQKEYETWQPDKLVKFLLEVEPTADKSTEMFVLVPNEIGAHQVLAVGGEYTMLQAQVRRSYQRLGSMVHQPALKKLSHRQDDLEAQRQPCEQLLAELERVLASPITNLNLSAYVSFPCVCGKTIRKRVKSDNSDTTATCECGEQYRVSDVPGSGGNKYKRLSTSLPCKTENCAEITQVSNRNLSPGYSWKCAGCGKQHQIVLACIEKKVG